MRPLGRRGPRDPAPSLGGPAPATRRSSRRSPAREGLSRCRGHTLPPTREPRVSPGPSRRRRAHGLLALGVEPRSPSLPAGERKDLRPAGPRGAGAAVLVAAPPALFAACNSTATHPTPQAPPSAPEGAPRGCKCVRPAAPGGVWPRIIETTSLSTLNRSRRCVAIVWRRSWICHAATGPSWWASTFARVPSARTATTRSMSPTPALLGPAGVASREQGLAARRLEAPRHYRQGLSQSGRRGIGRSSTDLRTRPGSPTGPRRRRGRGTLLRRPRGPSPGAYLSRGEDGQRRRRRDRGRFAIEGDHEGRKPSSPERTRSDCRSAPPGFLRPTNGVPATYSYSTAHEYSPKDLESPVRPVNELRRARRSPH